MLLSPPKFAGISIYHKLVSDGWNETYQNITTKISRNLSSDGHFLRLSNLGATNIRFRILLISLLTCLCKRYWVDRDIGSILSLGLLSKNQTNVQITLQNHNSLSCLFLGSCHQFVSHFICGDSRGVWGVSNTIKRIKRVRHVQNNILSYIFNVFLGHMFIQLLWTWECSSKNFQITTPANLYCIRFES